MAESRLELRTRLLREGRWDAYQIEYEQLKDSGCSAKQARDAAAAKFPRLDERQLEEINQERVQAEQKQATQNRQQEELLVQLVLLAADRDANERAVVSWVFENALVPLELLDPDSIPSKGALGLWRWVNITPTNYTEFVKTVWSKLLPSRTQTDSEGGPTDDGRDLFPLLDEFTREFEAGPEESSDEHSVSSPIAHASAEG